MTVKTKHYDTETTLKTGNAREATNGFRTIHTDFTNNDVKQGYDVTYDDKLEIVPARRKLTETDFIRELAIRSNVDII